ncbi:MAG: potassium channel family protein [Candidatus Woesearchaeota archaeon]
MNKLHVSFCIIIILITIGTIFYSIIEGWSILDSAYFSTTTLTTIGGYGDLHPTTNYSKLFTIFYVLSSVSVGLYALSSLGSYQQPKFEKALIRAIRKMPVQKLRLLTTEINERLKGGRQNEIQATR